MKNLAKKVTPKLKKVIRRFPTKALVFREEYDKYKEPLGEVLKCELVGFYHDTNYKLGIDLKDTGITLTNKPGRYLMVPIDETTKILNKGDILYLCDEEGNKSKERYEIIDLGDLNRMGIYYDLNLRECPE